KHTGPRRAGEVRDPVPGHRAKDKRALLTEVDAAALLGEALAQTDEQVWRAHAQRPAEEGEGQSPKVAHHVHPIAPSVSPGGAGSASGSGTLTGFGSFTGASRFITRPRSVSLARITTKRIPSRTLTVASGRWAVRCSRPPLAPMLPTRTDTGMMATGCWRA